MQKTTSTQEISGRREAIKNDDIDDSDTGKGVRQRRKKEEGKGAGGESMVVAAEYENRFPDLNSLAIILNRNFVAILTFSIVVPTSEAYATALGASRVFRSYYLINWI